MKPPINLRKCFTVATFAVILFWPVTSKEAVSKASNMKKITATHADAAAASHTAAAFNLIVPAPPAPRQGHHGPADAKKDNHDEMKKGRAHADEEKHKNHLYHYDRVKRRKKVHTSLVCFFLKIFIAISYISVLICGYLSICH